jgi:urease accessory protein
MASVAIASTRAPQHSRLDLLLERVGGITRPARCAAQPPLQLSRARYDDGARPDQVTLTLLHLGGVLAGDRYDLRVALGAGAAARVITAAAAQVYRMPHEQAAQRIQLELGPHSRLEWLPEPTILFGGARFTQATSVTLGPGARLALLDVLAPGRLARGEAYAFERYAMRLDIYSATGCLLAAERALLEPSRRHMAAPGMFGDTPVVGSLYILGQGVDVERGCALVARCGDGRLGAAPLPNECGLLVRALGHAPSQVRGALLDLWGALDK